jgi:hypothetical protein
MNAEQIAFSFRVKQTQSRNTPNTDLIGLSYKDGYATIVVTGVCLDDTTRVIVERDLDGRIWSMPGWVMRMVFMEEKKSGRLKILPRYLIGRRPML